MMVLSAAAVAAAATVDATAVLLTTMLLVMTVAYVHLTNCPSGTHDYGHTRCISTEVDYNTYVTNGSHSELVGCQGRVCFFTGIPRR